MRKDLKIGMAIGAVLLVVLIVYIAVPKEGADVAQNPDGAGDNAAQTDGDASIADAGAADAPGATSLGATADARGPAAAGADAATGGDIFDEKPAGGAAAAGRQQQHRLGQHPRQPRGPDHHHAAAQQRRPRAPGRRARVDRLSHARRGRDARAGQPRCPPPAEPQATTPDLDDAAPVQMTTAAGAGSAATVGPRESAPAPGGARTHTVARGETFSSIAALVYKDERQYLAIQDANPTIDARRLRPGTVINLPDPAAVKSEKSDDAPATPGESTPAARPDAKPLDPATEYKVQSGDSLYKIALKRYGTSTMADDLYEANQATIGPDSSRLKVGMVLKLPPSPAAEPAAR
jgi:nucleoid-associated protein YgaU